MVLRLPILMYHKIQDPPAGAGYAANYLSPGQFEEQLAALRRWGYTSITLDDWLTLRTSRNNAPSRPVVLTLDDGYRSNYQIAWPLLRKYDACATIFLVTNFIGAMNRWDLGELQEPLLNSEEILEMQAGGISFGSHTCTHKSLIDMPAAEAWKELTESRIHLQKLLGRPVLTLAYPYNKNSFKVRNLARKAGYQAAVLGRGSVNAPWTSHWALRRIHVKQETSLDELHHRLTSWRSLASI